MLECQWLWLGVLQTTLVKNIFYDQLTDNIMINLYFAISERISALQWYIISLYIIYRVRRNSTIDWVNPVNFEAIDYQNIEEVFV